ncbi:hypothetical protein AX16_003744 [Volvariella volvacea WC 439]|nr:hypothetical protein AX16_003744 [Volvariella volvacea WC 439]
MVYISPAPAPNRLSYAQAYNSIVAAYRRSPLTSASSVIVLSAPNVDALCAARLLADLFKQDDVLYRIRPVSGIIELERVREELMATPELHTLIMLNMGGILDLPSSEWFGDFGPQLTVHVIDSARPVNLASLFGTGPLGDRIVVWDDGSADELTEERRAWEFMTYEPISDSDEDDSEIEEDAYDDEAEHDQEEGSSTKRRSTGANDGHDSKRRRLYDDDRPSRRSTREEREQHSMKLNKYYSAGTWHGQSAAVTAYILATALERVDNDLLWCALIFRLIEGHVTTTLRLAILGLTHQYNTSKISRERYEYFHSIYHDEVSRLNPPLPDGFNGYSLTALTPDDVSIRPIEELRFMHFRHWTLYDAMLHSSYIASKLGIWKERGRKRLTGLLAKMGFSIPQTQQPYHHMDLDLKKDLVKKLTDIAPEYGLVELSYPSFMRCSGYKSQPLSASDAVEGITALLDVAGGVRLEVEIEGARNGGEWFGGGRLWEARGREKEPYRVGSNDTRESGLPNGSHGLVNGVAQRGDGEAETADPTEAKPDEAWWVKNFWTAYDALADIVSLRESLNLSMSLHRAIIRQGTSIIDKQDIKTMRNHRVVVLSQGPDLVLFCHPAVLSRLALWLVDALREKLPGTSVNGRSKRKSLPFVVACLDEVKKSYVVVGVMGALEFGDVRKNSFSAAFIHAQARCNAEVTHVSFDTNVIEINQTDLGIFLEALCEGPETGR